MQNKLAITIVALMVAALVAPAVMGATSGSASYEATVFTGQNTVVNSSSTGDFGSVQEGGNATIGSSLILNNDGGWEATVSAASDGLADEALVGATLTDLKLTKDSNTYDVVVGASLDNILPSGSATYGATLIVPSGQTAGVYSGTIDLTFGNA